MMLIFETMNIFYSKSSAWVIVVLFLNWTKSKECWILNDNDYSGVAAQVFLTGSYFMALYTANNSATWNLISCVKLYIFKIR